MQAPGSGGSHEEEPARGERRRCLRLRSVRRDSGEEGRSAPH